MLSTVDSSTKRSPARIASPLRAARAAALAEHLGYCHGPADLDHLARRFRAIGWTRTAFETAVEDLVIDGRAEVSHVGEYLYVVPVVDGGR